MTSIATGGKAIYDALLGMLVLEARFPRGSGGCGERGDVAVSGIVSSGEGGELEARGALGAAGLLPAFLEAAAELVSYDAEAITTNCGFLSLSSGSWRRMCRCRWRRTH